MVVGERPASITIPWQVLLVFCAMVIIVLGIVVGWLYPWLGLPVAYIVITVLIFLACFARYQSRA